MTPVSKISHSALFINPVGRYCSCSWSFPWRLRWNWDRSISNFQKKACEYWNRALPYRSNWYMNRGEEEHHLSICFWYFNHFGLEIRNDFDCGQIHLQTQIFISTLFSPSLTWSTAKVTVLSLFIVRVACVWCVYRC